MGYIHLLFGKAHILSTNHERMSNVMQRFLPKENDVVSLFHRHDNSFRIEDSVC